MKLLIIYNCHAANRRAGRIKDDIAKRFVEKRVQYDIEETEYQGHAINLVAKKDLSPYDGIVAAGGDGTLFEVITGYFKNAGKPRIPLGILPIGTGNAFARDMAETVPLWPDAVDIIVQGKTHSVDVGQFDSEGIRLYFLNILGLGFVADVGKIASSLKWLGNLSYTIGVLHQTLFLNATQMKITLDGKVIERENIFVEISNSRYTSNFFMAPDARIDDGFFDVTLLGKMTRRQLLSAFPKVFTGEHIHLSQVEQIRAKHILVETETPKILTPDGELLGETPVTVECLHRAIKVFWP
ncbi:diacylglycerol kinase family lipid kinase [bacterium]|nr:diacylglycerol kinase family lipid kinase [bacterium]